MPSSRTRTERRKTVSTHETKNRGFYLAQNVGERKFWQGMIPYGTLHQIPKMEEQGPWSAELLWDQNCGWVRRVRGLSIF